MESLTFDATGTIAAEDRALALLRDVWLAGARGRGHEMLLATKRVLDSGRLVAREAGRPPPPEALAAARAAGAEARARGGGGTTLPGRLLLSEHPAALSVLGRRLRLGSVIVGGTNGKTTTAAMIASVLRASGLEVVHNRAGANTHWGVATAVIEQGGDIGVFEVDEAWLPLVAVELAPRVIVLGNLFRDRIDGYGELDAIADAWRSIARRASAAGTSLVLDADDPAIAALDGPGGSAVLYGIEDAGAGYEDEEHAVDATLCRRCGARLHSERRFLSHLGHWSCPGCRAARPAPSVAAARIDLRGLSGSRVRMDTPGGRLDVRMDLPGVFNVYNALAAAATAVTLDVPNKAIVAGLARVRPQFGRGERIALGGRAELVILLMKNPAGANTLLRLLETESDEHPLELWIGLNDSGSDGGDVSWIWDADFERLAAGVGRVTCAGNRAAELALRLRYAGWRRESIAVDESIEASFDDALAHASGRLIALPTYSALLELRALLTRRGLVPPYWE